MILVDQISFFEERTLASAKRPKEAAITKGQPPAAVVRGSPEWKEWVEDLARANRQTVSGLVDTALAQLAQNINFRKPPPR